MTKVATFTPALGLNPYELGPARSASPETLEPALELSSPDLASQPERRSVVDFMASAVTVVKESRAYQATLGVLAAGAMVGAVAPAVSAKTLEVKASNVDSPELFQAASTRPNLLGIIPILQQQAQNTAQSQALPYRKLPAERVARNVDASSRGEFVKSLKMTNSPGFRRVTWKIGVDDIISAQTVGYTYTPKTYDGDPDVYEDNQVQTMYAIGNDASTITRYSVYPGILNANGTCKRMGPIAKFVPEGMYGAVPLSGQPGVGARLGGYVMKKAGSNEFVDRLTYDLKGVYNRPLKASERGRKCTQVRTYKKPVSSAINKIGVNQTYTYGPFRSSTGTKKAVTSKGRGYTVSETKIW